MKTMKSKLADARYQIEQLRRVVQEQSQNACHHYNRVKELEQELHNIYAGTVLNETQIRKETMT